MTITAPEEFTTGQQAVITVDAHTEAAVDGFSVFLDVLLPDRLPVESVMATGFTESVVVFGSNTATVSGRVWNDLNRDGRQNRHEPGIAGITVFSQFTTVVTGEDGSYELTDQELGDTTVFFVAPGKFDFTKPNVGDDQHDSDVESTARDCLDCVRGFVPLHLTGPTEHVDAALFDPKASPPSRSPTPSPTHGGTPPAPTPTHGSTPPPQPRPVTGALAFTGAPITGLTGISALLLAAGVALLTLQRRHSGRRT